MNQSYRNMRNFWIHEVKHEKKVSFPQIGPQDIIIAGSEFVMADADGKLKHIFIAANSLGDVSMYFENNSPSGIGALMGGEAQEQFKGKGVVMIAAAAAVSHDMEKVFELPAAQARYTTFFAVSKGHLYVKQIQNTEVLRQDHPFHPFMDAGDKLISAFRITEEKPQADA
ncbi:hypothetical protein Dip518_000604 [Parelusimicrobium proximum]|uniref:hypothetical protein n=1 Tax=Parelusimicrobium proximum TaxID=3228953 RepID=UPI003D1741E1